MSGIQSQLRDLLVLQDAVVLANPGATNLSPFAFVFVVAVLVLLVLALAVHATVAVSLAPPTTSCVVAVP